MTDRVTFIEHAGARILLSDLSGIRTVEELQGAIRLGTEIVQAQPPMSVLILVDVTGLEYNVENFAILQQSVAANRPYVKARAIVGLSPLAAIPFEIVAKLSARPMARFDDRDSAREWLARHR